MLVNSHPVGLTIIQRAQKEVEEFGPFASTTVRNKYAHTKKSGHKESWQEVSARVAAAVVRPYLPHLESATYRLILQRKLMPGGRYLYASGRRFPQIANCFLYRAEDSREGWAELLNKCAHSLMTGGGVGVVYSDVRPADSDIHGMGGKSTGPIALMNMINECGRHIVQGGSRRSALWAGLHWWHPDVFRFITCKRYSALIRECKERDFNFPAPMDGTNISVITGDDFFTAVNDPSWSKEYRLWGAVHTVNHAWAKRVYEQVTFGMCTDGEPGLSVDTGGNTDECLRNACCEVTSKDDGDSCNLASLNLARIESADELAWATEVGAAFLLCGTLYGKMPLQKLYQTREKNRRLGLGLMGVHEWLLQRGRRYGPDTELAQWLTGYVQSGEHAARYADVLGVSTPVATRSIAPTGTISIIAETTSGIEPLYAAAYKRRYLDGPTWKAQYVVDATAKRIVERHGVDPEQLEDAVTLSEDVGRRIQFQEWMQRHVDHAISSTINLPSWGSSLNNAGTLPRFASTLLKHLPGLRGITCYPDGSRGGQPLNRVPYAEAAAQVGVELVEGNEHSCKGGVCGT